MKILFISDIHGVYDNLKQLIELDKKEKFDKIVVLGDIYYCYDLTKITDTKSVKDFLNNNIHRLIALRGNIDSDYDVQSSRFKLHEGLYLLEDNIYCNHGHQYNIDNYNGLKQGDILIYGHLHYPFIKEQNGIIFINVGSISLPRNNSEPSYGIYENKKFKIYGITQGLIIKKEVI